MRLLVVSHDAGGAEVVSAWLRRQPAELPFPCVLGGPARAIFARKLGDRMRPLDELPPLQGFELVLCGSSGAADLERLAVRAALAGGVRCAVWLDHWVRYRERFELDGRLVLPDEVWVSDEHAARMAKAELPGAAVRLMGNPYLEDVAEEIRAATVTARRTGLRVLYVTEPTSAAAERVIGDPLGWGYDEFQALAWFAERMAAEPVPPTDVRVRLHPSEPAGKYDTLITRLRERLRMDVVSGTSLVEDCAWADVVAGCDTMAMVVALAAGRRVISSIPPGGKPMTLPFPEIERLHA